MEDSGADLGGNEIAIVGLACRVPGAEDADQFWRNLAEGRCSIEQLTGEQGGDHPLLGKTGRKVPVAACAPGVELFDAEFFGFPPRQAEITDPQHRLFLELAWHALEDAAVDPQRFDGEIGVVVGATASRYLYNILSRSDVLEAVGIDQVALGNNLDFLPTMVSYKLGLSGPSLGVQTACSSSLTAVHAAAQMLLAGECDLALAGGVSIRMPPRGAYSADEGGVVSPHGVCRPFDANADGTVFGSGAGVVVLQRLDDAIAKNSRIRAILKATAINNDGSARADFAAPGLEGQASVILQCQAAAGVTAETIGYVEAHGTGTRLGDPIEVAALIRAFRFSTDRRRFCALGSVKANVGHLDAAAEIVGLLKTVLMLENRELVPTLNFERANPEIPLAESPFHVQTRRTRWESGGGPRRAAVSSFGIGGTNVHAIVEEAPERPVAASSEPQVLIVSARTPTALEAARTALAQALATGSESLSDVAYTLHSGRRHFPFRDAVACLSREQAVAGLERTVDGTGAAKDAPKLVFLFPGQGDALVAAGRRLYETLPAFRATIDECLLAVGRAGGEDLRPWFDGAADTRRLRGAELQPLLFSLQIALARQWAAWGVKPDAVLGHSLGEYVAACVAGVMSLDSALTILVARGKLTDAAPEGSMLAIVLDEANLRRRLPDGVTLAAVNGPTCVAAGEPAAIHAFAAELEADGIASRRLDSNRAFHSPLMISAADGLARIVDSLELSPAALPMLSGHEGSWANAGSPATGRYWRDHLLEPVRFADCARIASAQSDVVFLEVGWGSVLTSLVEAQGAIALPSIPSKAGHDDERDALFGAAARLWCHGVAVEWSAVMPTGGASVGLPGYPFERQRYWVDPGCAIAAAEPDNPRRTVALYEPAFRRATGNRPSEGGRGELWLALFPTNATELGVVEALRAAGESVIVVEASAEFAALGPDRYGSDPDSPSELKHLATELARVGRDPTRIIVFVEADESDAPDLWRPFGRGLAACQAIDRHMSEARQVWFVTQGAMDVLGDEPVQPHVAMTLGLTRVMLQETGSLVGRHLDLPPWEDRSAVCAQAAAELLSDPDETLIALRAGRRWCLGVRQVEDPGSASPPSIRSDGVYLITGGLGRLGLVLARHLALAHGARVVLTTRTRAEEALTPERLAELDELRGAGAALDVRRADASDQEATRTLIAAIREQYGRLDGVIHAAGLVGELAHRSLAEATVEQSRALFDAKVTGVRALADALGDHDCDFVMLVSSMSPLLGGLGLGAYSAANIFMDSFAARAVGPGRWISVNWEGWSRQGGDMVGSEASEIAGLVLDDQEIATRFDQILALPGTHRLIVANGELEDRLRRWASVSGLADLFEMAPTAKHDGVQAIIRQYASELLGHDGFDDDANLLEQGANSLTAIRLIARIRETFDADIPMRALFESPTVSSLATAVTAMIDEDDAITIELVEEAEPRSSRDGAGALANVPGAGDLSQHPVESRG